MCKKKNHCEEALIECLTSIENSKIDNNDYSIVSFQDTGDIINLLYSIQTKLIFSKVPVKLQIFKREKLHAMFYWKEFDYNEVFEEYINSKI